MTVSAATLLIDLLALYAGLGVIFAIPFLLWGVSRIDPVARDGSWGFRLIIFPGVIALWPLLALRWYSGAANHPVERNAHRLAATKRPRAGS